MIRTLLPLARSSFLSVTFLFAAMLTIVTILSDGSEDAADVVSPLAAALAPVPKLKLPEGDGPAATRIALFDPERRPETVAGSIDDLRGLASPPPPPVNVAISGVLINGSAARALLAATGASPAWVTVGGDVGGWHVESVTAQGAVLSHEGRSLTLRVADRLAARTAAHVADTGSAPAQDPNISPESPTAPASPDPSANPQP